MMEAVLTTAIVIAAGAMAGALGYWTIRTARNK